MKKCTLCGGVLDQNKRCTFCGLDNTKNDDMYKHLVNQNVCTSQPLTHVHGEGNVTTSHNKQNQTNIDLKKIIGIIALILTILSYIFGMIGEL